MRFFVILVLLSALTGCRTKRAPAPLPQGWQRVTVEREFTIDMPSSMAMEPQGIGMQIDPDRFPPDGGGRMLGASRRLGWSWWHERTPYHPKDMLRRAREHPVWWTQRTRAALLHLDPKDPVAKTDTVIETHVVIAEHRRVVEAYLLEPAPSDTATTRRILGSIRFLSDGE